MLRILPILFIAIFFINSVEAKKIPKKERKDYDYFVLKDESKKNMVYAGRNVPKREGLYRFHENFEVARRYGFTKHHFATNAMLLSLDRLRQLPSDGMAYVMTPDFCSDEAYFEPVEVHARHSPAKPSTLLRSFTSDAQHHGRPPGQRRASLP